MKIDRLTGIIVALLQNEKATAPILAKKFEVSRRTSYWRRPNISRSATESNTANRWINNIELTGKHRGTVHLCSEKMHRGTVPLCTSE